MEKIDLNFIKKIFFDNEKNQNINRMISSYDESKIADVLNGFEVGLTEMYVALNSDKIDVEFVTKRFKHYYSTAEKYNGELRGLKIKYDHLMFRQAFLKNPDKFRQIEEFIPVNLGFSIKMSIPEGKNPVLCHSIGGEVTENSLIYSHKIMIGRAINSSKFVSDCVCVYFDQTDKESTDIQEMFRLIGEKPQNISDASILNEEQMTRTDWDITLFDSNPGFEDIGRVSKSIFVYGNFVDNEELKKRLSMHNDGFFFFGEEKDKKKIKLSKEFCSKYRIILSLEDF